MKLSENVKNSVSFFYNVIKGMFVLVILTIWFFGKFSLSYMNGDI